MENLSPTAMTFEEPVWMDGNEPEEDTELEDNGNKAPADDTEPEDDQTDDTDIDEDYDETDDTDADSSDEDEEEGEEYEDDEEADDEQADEKVRSVVGTVQAEADSVAALLSKAGVNYNELVEEYRTLGQLSPKSLVALEKAGYAKTLVDSFIEGQQARMDIYATRVQNYAGGEKQYAKLMQWAAKNLSAKERERYDKAVDSNDIDEAKFAVAGLKARYERTIGVAPKLVRGHSAKEVGVKPFRSFEDMARAIDDERYETDPAYTKKVERRMLASNF